MPELLTHYPSWLGFTAAAILGMIIGSFINVVIYRLPKILRHRWQREMLSPDSISHSKDEKTLSLVYPPSHCPHCASPILWQHKIPVVSFILLKGRCAYCGEPIEWRYLQVEVVTGCAWLAIFYLYGISYLAMAGALLVSCLIALTYIDQREGLLPDEITLPLLWVGLLLNSFELIVPPQHAVFGAVAGYLSFYLLNMLFKQVRHRHGIGMGDMKLVAALGAWLGWQALPNLVLIASLLGLCVAVVLYFRRSVTLSDAIPFGPYLSFAGILSFLFYQQLTDTVLFL